MTDLNDLKKKVAELEDKYSTKITPELAAQYFGTDAANALFNIESSDSAVTSSGGIPLGADYENIEPKQYSDEIYTDSHATPSMQNITADAIKSHNDELKLKLKNLTANQLASIGVAQLVPGKDDEIICPFCGNGSGNNRTGLSPTCFTNGFQYHCFKCNESFDNLNLFALYFNLDINRDFQEILKRAAELSKGIHVVEPSKVEKKEELTEEQKAKTAADISEYSKWINDCPEEDQRHLKLETHKHFNCGYAINWISPKIPSKYLPPTNRLIIPNSPYSYNAILPLRFRPNIDKKHWKLNVNPKQIFNFDNAIASNKPIIIVEGEIDAMSIWQATDGNVEPVALLGTGFKNLIARLDDKFPDKNERLKLSFVVLLDNDDAGIKESQKLTDALIKHGYPAIADFLIFGADKVDANDFLCSQGDDALKSRIDQIIADAIPKLDDARKKINAEIKTDHLFEKPKVKSSTKDVMPDCPIDLYMPAFYDFFQNGIVYKQDIICHNPVVITKRLHNVDTLDPHKYFTEIAHFDLYYKKWFYNIFPNDVLFDFREIKKLINCGIDFSQEDAKKLSKYFLKLSSLIDNFFKIPHNNLYKFPGWTDDSCSKFILPGHLQDGDVLNDPSGFYRKKYTEKGDFNKWRLAVKKLFLNPDISPAFKIIFGASLAAPLYRVLGVRNSQFLLWCTSGKGKSATMKIAMSIYGNPEELKNTFNATPNAINGISRYYNDLPVWFDEFQTANKNIHDDLSSLAYGFSEAKTRAIQNRDGDNKPTFRFHGVRFFTGEQPILPDNSDAGAYNRLLSISTDQLFPPNTDIAEIHRFFDNNHGFFGWTWINFISQHIDGIKTQYKINQKGFDSIARKNNWTNGWIDDLAAILTAWQFAINLINDSDELSPADTQKIFMRKFEIIDKELPRNSSFTVQKRAKESLEDLINSHPKIFGKELTNGDFYISQYAPYVAGYQFLDGSFGFIPHELKKLLHDELGFASPESILRGWLDNGLLEPPNNNHKYARRKKIRINQNLKNVMLVTFYPHTLNADVAVNDDESY